MGDMWRFAVLGLAATLCLGVGTLGLLMLIGRVRRSRFLVGSALFAGVLSLVAVALLFSESVLMLLFDCWHAYFWRACRWHPSLEWWPWVLHRWILSAIFGFSAAALLSMRVRRFALHRVVGPVWTRLRRIFRLPANGSGQVPPRGLRLLAVFTVLPCSVWSLGALVRTVPPLFDFDLFLGRRHWDSELYWQWVVALMTLLGAVLALVLGDRLLRGKVDAWIAYWVASLLVITGAIALLYGAYDSLVGPAEGTAGIGPPDVRFLILPPIAVPLLVAGALLAWYLWRRRAFFFAR